MNRSLIGKGNSSTISTNTIDSTTLQQKQADLGIGGAYGIDTSGNAAWNTYHYIYSYLGTAPQKCMWEDTSITPSHPLGAGTLESPYIIYGAQRPLRGLRAGWPGRVFCAGSGYRYGRQ
jgi:hypothetical protein